MTEDEHRNEARPSFPPAVRISVTFRQVGEGVETIDVSWDVGTEPPNAEGLCRIVSTIFGRRVSPDEIPVKRQQ